MLNDQPGAANDKLMRRIAKILALAERGDAGEKDTAQAMLANILARHGLTLDDIAAKPARKWVEVTFSGDHEQQLMDQVIRKVTQQREFMIKRIPRTRTRYYVELSQAEQVEVEFMFEVMKAAFAKEVARLMSAFIHTNDLYGPKKEAPDDEEPPELTPEQRAEIKRISTMAMMMDRVPVHRAIKGPQ